MGDENKLIINPDIVFREEAGEAILFDPSSGNIKLLNETGTFIYRLLNGKNKRHDILKHLSDHYTIQNEGELEKDLDDFLDELRKLQLLGTLE